MATYIYTGRPTRGQTTRDIKLPNEQGSFTIYENITPNVTPIVTTDTSEIGHMVKYPNNYAQQ